MLCLRGKKVTFDKAHEECYACTMKIKIVDAPEANVYMFMELVICAMSVAVGYRTEPDFAPMYGHAASGHSFNPDEINKHIFDDPKGEFMAVKDL